MISRAEELCAKAKFLITKKKNRLQDVKEALKLLNEALGLEPKFALAWIVKASAHIKMEENIEAAIALDMASTIDPKHPQIKMQLDLLSTQVKDKDPGRYKARLKGIDKDKYDYDHLETDYLPAFCELQARHKETYKRAFEHQLDWVLECMRFVFKSSESRLGGKPHGSLDPKEGKLSQSSQFKKYEIELLCQYLNAKNKLKPGNAAQFFVDELSNLISCYQDTSRALFINDVRSILRMVFETMHQFPRSERGRLAEFLPWDNNSWFHFEFIGSVVGLRSKEANQYSSFLVHPGTFNLATNKNLVDFHYSVAHCTYLIDQAISDIVGDLKKLEKFIFSVKSCVNIADYSKSDYSKVIKLDDVPNLKAFLWYYKNAFNLFRALIILPEVSTSNNHVEFSYGNVEGLMSLPSTQLSYENPSLSLSTIKGRLSLLRRMQMVGELFTNKNIGQHIQRVDFIDPDILYGIRDGLSHLESLSSIDFVEDTEEEANILLKLMKELNSLKVEIYEHVANWQKRFGQWPNTLTTTYYEPALVGYWEKVKNHYQQDSQLNESNSVEKLLSQAEIDVILEQIDSTQLDASGQSIKSEIKAMLNGEKPLDLARFHKVEFNQYSQKKETSYWPYLVKIDDKKLNRERGKKIEGYFKRAETAYGSTKKLAKNNQKEAKNESHSKLMSRRNENTDKKYPYIKLFGLKMLEELGQGKVRQSASDIFDCLKSRITILIDMLLDENLIELVIMLDAVSLEEKIKNDMRLNLSCSYLIGQIISIMNKLHSLDALQQINPILVERLSDYVALRNALEHTDSIIETKGFEYTQMMSDVPKLMAYFICELQSNSLIELYFERQTQAQASSTPAPALSTPNTLPTVSNTPEVPSISASARVKQDKPLSISGSFGDRYLADTTTTTSPVSSSSSFFPNTKSNQYNVSASQTRNTRK